MDLRLSPEEAGLLREILADRHAELFREISRPEHHHFKTALRQKEALVAAVAHKLDALLEESCATLSNDPTLG
ncbi:MAG TPA: hypothetical protein VJQ59_09165 [Candidatus Sulfotelmatobacter sp.]|nr:hypothetical protein [Candidatus Sulfotelmatobacter sp.]